MIWNYVKSQFYGKAIILHRNTRARNTHTHTWSVFAVSNYNCDTIHSVSTFILRLLWTINLIIFYVFTWVNVRDCSLSRSLDVVFFSTISRRKYATKKWHAINRIDMGRGWYEKRRLHENWNEFYPFTCSTTAKQKKILRNIDQVRYERFKWYLI